MQNQWRTYVYQPHVRVCSIQETGLCSCGADEKNHAAVARLEQDAITEQVEERLNNPQFHYGSSCSKPGSWNDFSAHWADMGRRHWSRKDFTKLLAEYVMEAVSKAETEYHQKNGVNTYPFFGNWCYTSVCPPDWSNEKVMYADSNRLPSEVRAVWESAVRKAWDRLRRWDEFPRYNIGFTWHTPVSTKAERTLNAIENILEEVLWPEEQVRYIKDVLVTYDSEK